MSDLNTITNQLFDRREAMRPDARTWAKHRLFLLITFLTVTVAGVLQPFGIVPIFPNANPQSWSEILVFLLSLPARYVGLISDTIYQLLTNFGSFAVRVEIFHLASYYFDLPRNGTLRRLPYLRR